MHSVVPLVSIIIPVYNCENFLHSCFYQLLNIDYNNLEFIFIDNNSTDNSFELLCVFEKKDSRVRVLKEIKQGAGFARNAGLISSKGEIVSFLDVDDMISSDKISNHVQILTQNPTVDFVFGKMIKFYPENSYSYTIPMHNEIKSGIYKNPFLGLFWLEHFGRLPGTCAITCLKKIIFKESGFLSEFSRGEDAALFIRLAINYIGYYDERICSTYVRHPSSSVTLSNIKSDIDPYFFQYKSFYLPYFSSILKNQIALNILYLKIGIIILEFSFHAKDVPIFSKYKLQLIEILNLSDYYPRYKINFLKLILFSPQPIKSFFIYLLKRKKYVYANK